jgi:hypothetical protein
MATVIVQPRYPNDPLPEVVTTFVNALSVAVSDCDVVAVVEEPHGHQVSPHEIIFVWVPAIASTAASVAVIVEKVSAWLKRRHDDDMGVRPRSVKLYGPDGRLLKELSMKHGRDSQVQEVDGNRSDAIRLPPRQP